MAAAAGSVIPGWDEPPETIEFWHLDAEVGDAVGRWFGGWVPRGAQLDGNRSVLLPLDTGRWIKVKGAGFNGGPVDFRSYRKTGPRALWFDFEGRVADDHASGHDAAHPGGASYQQAVTEWNVSRELAGRSERVLPCLGYGRISMEAETSWFSVFEWSARYSADTSWPLVAPEVYLDRVLNVGRCAQRLALTHGMIGYPWLMPDGEGGQIIKDLHPFRKADPVNMSQVSFAMQLFYAIHIIASDVRLRAEKFPGLPADVQIYPFKASCPDVTLEDHQDAIRKILLPYMLRPEPGFHVGRLLEALTGNRLTARLLEIVPSDYAPFSSATAGQSRLASSGS